MIDPLLKKLKTYYNKLKDPSFILGSWVVANDRLYNKYKNKLNIISVNSIMGDQDQRIIVCESKNKYYAIKYNSNFICIREANNEYGLVLDDYELLAINKEILYKAGEITKQPTKNITLTELAETFSWKLGKKAKKDLIDFD